MDDNKIVSEKNALFWNDLCGHGLATMLGIADSSNASLKKYDVWYFDIYPYLIDHIPFEKLKGKDVLEIGLGFGAISQRLAETGCNYLGLDIANGPIDMVNLRLLQSGLQGRAIQGSILDPCFEKDSFDFIIAIGCLHHTGSLKLALDKCYELLKPNGHLIFMVYSAYSYRRWMMSPYTTFKYFIRELIGYRGVVGKSNDMERAAYDTSKAGGGAPHTDWISQSSLQSLCSKFSTFSAKYENIDVDWYLVKNKVFYICKYLNLFPLNTIVKFAPIGREMSREQLLKTKIPKYLGLDIYVDVKK